MDSEMLKWLARDAAGLAVPRDQGEVAFAAAVDDLAVFVRDRGRAPEAGAEDRDEGQLGTWLNTQRAAERNGRLSARRAAILEGVLGPGWAR